MHSSFSPGASPHKEKCTVFFQEKKDLEYGHVFFSFGKKRIAIPQDLGYGDTFFFHGFSPSFFPFFAPGEGNAECIFPWCKKDLTRRKSAVCCAVAACSILSRFKRCSVLQRVAVCCNILHKCQTHTSSFKALLCTHLSFRQKKI